MGVDRAREAGEREDGAPVASRRARPAAVRRPSRRAPLRVREPPARLGPLGLPRQRHPRAAAGAACLLPPHARARAPGRLRRRGARRPRPSSGASLSPPRAADPRRGAGRPEPARAGVPRDRAREPGRGLPLRRGAGARDLRRRPRAPAPADARGGLRGVPREERRADRLRLRGAPLRPRRHRDQRLPDVPVRGVPARLRPLRGAVPPPLRAEEAGDAPVPARAQEPRGDRGGLVLVLLQAGVPPGGRGRASRGPGRGGAARAAQGLALESRDAPAARPERSRSLPRRHAGRAVPGLRRQAGGPGRDAEDRAAVRRGPPPCGRGDGPAGRRRPRDPPGAGREAPHDPGGGARRGPPAVARGRPREAPRGAPRQGGAAREGLRARDPAGASLRGVVPKGPRLRSAYPHPSRGRQAPRALLLVPRRPGFRTPQGHPAAGTRSSPPDALPQVPSPHAFCALAR